MSNSLAYKSRQKTRKNGRYTEMYKCEVCNKSIGENYYSLPNTHDRFCRKIGIDGLSLCGKCCDVITPQYNALVQGKEIEVITKNQLTVFYIETLVRNGFDIAPFLFKMHKPTTGEMLDKVNEYAEFSYFTLQKPNQ